MLAKELSLSDDDRDIAAYALHGIFSVSFYISTLLFTSWILGLFHTTMTIAATVALLRTFMGGAHASTAWRCGIIGAFLMNSGAIVAQALYKLAILQNDWVQLGVTVVMVGIALAAIAAYCPADTPAKPITDPAQRRRLRLISAALVVGVWGPVTALAIGKGWDQHYFGLFIGLCIQLLLVTPVGYAWSDRVERLVDHTYVARLQRKEE